MNIQEAHWSPCRVQRALGPAHLTCCMDTEEAASGELSHFLHIFSFTRDYFQLSWRYTVRISHPQWYEQVGLLSWPQTLPVSGAVFVVTSCWTLVFIWIHIKYLPAPCCGGVVCPSVLGTDHRLWLSCAEPAQLGWSLWCNKHPHPAAAQR